MAIWGIVPAAGVGARLGADVPKQYLQLAGRTIIECTLARLLEVPQIRQITVMLGAADEFWPQAVGQTEPRLRTAEGGSTRAQSVLNGLHSLRNQVQADDWILVHDAVRPCVRLSDINRLLQEVEEHPVGGLLASPVEHTLKRSRATDSVNRRLSISQETVDRSNLWYAFTPQVFRYGKLLHALEEALLNGSSVTDEASALEALGESPLLVRGSTDNLKITLASDLSMAELILNNQ